MIKKGDEQAIILAGSLANKLADVINSSLEFTEHKGMSDFQSSMVASIGILNFISQATKHLPDDEFEKFIEDVRMSRSARRVVERAFPTKHED